MYTRYIRTAVVVIIELSSTMMAVHPCRHGAMQMLALLLAAVGSAHANGGTQSGHGHSSRPASAPKDVDCAVRKLAHTFGASLVPEASDVPQRTDTPKMLDKVHRSSARNMEGFPAGTAVTRAAL